MYLNETFEIINTDLCDDISDVMYYNNLSPVTGADRIFRSRGETVTREPEISIRAGYL